MPPKENSPEKIVIQKLQEKNRPFSSISLGDELHNEIKQTQLKKILDQLSNDGVISCKIAGKAKVYFARQDTLQVATQEEIEEFDKRLDQLRDNYNQLSSRYEELKSRRDVLKRIKTIDELRKYRIEIEKKVQEETEKKDNLIKLAEGISPEDADKYRKNFSDRCSQWKSRKDKCKEIIDALSEGIDKKPSEICEELGLETDEDAGLKLIYKEKKFTIIEDNIP